MYRKILLLLSGVTLTLLATSACTLFSPAPPTTGPESLHTQAAQTISARLTEMAAAFTATPLPPTPTETNIQPTATETAVPLPSATPPPTATSVPASPTVTPIPCDWAQFVSDVRVKDGAEFTPQSVFTKTWRLKNTGACTWTTDYDLIFVSGDQLDGPDAVALPKSVKPGETIDLSVQLTAPSAKGDYRGNWQLRNASNKSFGVGPTANKTFWVDIEVVKAGDDYVYDFAIHYCVAVWKSAAGRLPCPGVGDEENGFMILLDEPEIEKGHQENEPAIWVHPQDTKDGWIRGEFPLIEVETGYHFRAIVGCLDGATKCNVTFKLQYQLEGGSFQTLWEGDETYDGNLTEVDVDLSALASKEVEFNLTVSANGSAEGDEAFWLAPHIVSSP